MRSVPGLKSVSVRTKKTNVDVASKTNLSKYERLLVVDWIQSIGGNGTRAELFADSVRRKAVHVNLDVRAHFLVRQKLSGNYLQSQRRREYYTGFLMFFLLGTNLSENCC